jgi:hypothetical protein
MEIILLAVLYYLYQCWKLARLNRTKKPGWGYLLAPSPPDDCPSSEFLGQAVG